jgi:N-acetylneuraminic acid mutarotase
VESYDPTTNQWTTHTHMPTARHHAASAVIDGKIYVIGGRLTNSLVNTDVVEKYDPTSDSWTTDLEPMPSKRSGIAATNVNGFIYVLVLHPVVRFAIYIIATTMPGGIKCDHLDDNS